VVANKITNNRISYALQRVYDGGGIYTLGAQPDSLIEGNFIHDLRGIGGAIYLDNGSRFFTVRRNVMLSAVYLLTLQPHLAPFAIDNVLEGNFMDSQPMMCCGDAGCCDDPERGNRISATTLLDEPTSSSAANALMKTSGLKPEFFHLRQGRVHVEAENYVEGRPEVAYHDLTTGNAGNNTYRRDHVDVYQDWVASNGAVVGYTQTGEWITFIVDIPESGEYQFDLSTATVDDACGVQVDVNGKRLTTFQLPNAGSYMNFLKVGQKVRLETGSHLFKFQFTGSFNFDYFDLIAVR